MSIIKATDLATGALKTTADRMGLILRLFWLPVLILVGIYAVFFAVSMGEVWSAAFSGEEIDPAQMQHYESFGFQAASWALTLAGVILLSPGQVAFSRVIAGQIEPPRGIVYFRYTAREWRYAGATTGLFLLYILFLSLAPGAISQTFGGYMAPGLTDTLPAGAAWGLFLVLTLAYIWLSIRLVPLLPMAAIENRIDLHATFRLSGGRFWKLLAAYLLLGVILLAIYIGFLVCAGIVAALLLIPTGVIGGEEGAAVIVVVIALMVLFALFYIAFYALAGGSLVALAVKAYEALKQPRTEEEMIAALSDDLPEEEGNGEDDPDEDGTADDKERPDGPGEPARP